MTVELGDKERWIVRTANIAVLDRAVLLLQEKIDAGDQVAAANGNLWWEARLDTLAEVRDELEAWSDAVREARS